MNTGTGFNADTYTLSEVNGPSGYTAGNWSCVVTDSDPPVSVPVTNGAVTVGLGDDVTCTINNDDNAPALHLRKTVTNDNGGAALVTDWTLNATVRGEPDRTCPVHTPVDSGPSFKADTYDLSETDGPSDYTAWSGAAS